MAHSVVCRIAVPFVRSCVRFASTYSLQQAKTAIAADSVVVFGKSYCHVCKDVVERFEDAEIPVKAVMLDEFENGNEVRDQLRQETGQENVPFVFLGGKFVPSTKALPGLKGTGKTAPLAPELEKATGKPIQGYFRS